MTKEQMGKEISHLKNKIKLLKSENEIISKIATKAINNNLTMLEYSQKHEQFITDKIIDEVLFQLDVVQYKNGVKFSDNDLSIIQYAIKSIKNNKYL